MENRFVVREKFINRHPLLTTFLVLTGCETAIIIAKFFSKNTTPFITINIGETKEIHYDKVEEEKEDIKK